MILSTAFVDWCLCRCGKLERERYW